MNEGKTMILQLFFDTVNTDIKDFLNYINNTDDTLIKKKDIEVFLCDLKNKLNETQQDLLMKG